MFSPGVSIPDLLKAIAKAKEVYEAFFGVYGNAPDRIKELADTVKYLHEVLTDCQTLLEKRRVPFPGLALLRRKLDECKALIQKYSELCPTTQASNADDVDVLEPTGEERRRIQTIRRVWQTTHYAFSADEVTRLKDDLSREMVKLNTFILIWAL